MSAALVDGRKPRVLTVLDTCTRECIALEGGSGFRGKDVAEILTRSGILRRLPRVSRPRCLVLGGLREDYKCLGRTVRGSENASGISR